MTIVQELDTIREYKQQLQEFASQTVKELIEFDFKEVSLERADILETIIQTLSIQVMLISMKEQIVSELNGVNFKPLLDIQSLIAEGKYSNLEHGYILLVLNLCRSNDYDILPCRSYEQSQSGK